LRLNMNERERTSHQHLDRCCTTLMSVSTTLLALIDAEIDRLQQARAAIGGAPAAKKGPGRLAKATVAYANKSGR
jgi:hypothetical protein